MALRKVDILEQVPSELVSPKKQFVVITDPLLEWIASPPAAANDHQTLEFNEFHTGAVKDRKDRYPATGQGAIPSARRTAIPQFTGALRGKMNQKQ
jgi:hypothetical protein